MQSSTPLVVSPSTTTDQATSRQHNSDQVQCLTPVSSPQELRETAASPKNRDRYGSPAEKTVLHIYYRPNSSILVSIDGQDPVTGTSRFFPLYPRTKTTVRRVRAARAVLCGYAVLIEQPSGRTMSSNERFNRILVDALLRTLKYSTVLENAFAAYHLRPDMERLRLDGLTAFAKLFGRKPDPGWFEPGVNKRVLEPGPEDLPPAKVQVISSSPTSSTSEPVSLESPTKVHTTMPSPTESSSSEPIKTKSEPGQVHPCIFPTCNKQYAHASSLSKHLRTVVFSGGDETHFDSTAFQEARERVLKMRPHDLYDITILENIDRVGKGQGRRVWKVSTRSSSSSTASPSTRSLSTATDTETSLSEIETPLPRRITIVVEDDNVFEFDGMISL